MPKLTAAAVARYKPGARRREIADAGTGPSPVHSYERKALVDHAVSSS